MPAALDRNYDGIIIGAGHHGLVLGSYLARCGLEWTGVCDTAAHS
jgi:phytoene dehydrogenase-like protein